MLIPVPPFPGFTYFVETMGSGGEDSIAKLCYISQQNPEKV